MPVLVAHGLAVFLEGNVRSDLEHLKIGAMVGIFGISLFAVSFPGVSKEVSFLRIPHLVFFIGKHFGTGAILSTAFCHLLPDAFDALKDREVNKRYHGIGRWAGLIILGSLLSIFLVEFISTSYVDHLHAKPSAPPSISVSAAPSRPKTPPANIIAPALPTSLTNRPNQLTSPVQCQSCLRSTDHGSSSTCALASTERTPLIRAPKRAKSFSNFDPHRDEPLLPLILLNSPRLSHSGLILGCDIPCICQLARVHEQASGMDNTDCEEDDTDHVAEDVKPKIGRRRQIVGILVLQLGIMIHSLVIGLTLAVTSGGEFTSLVTAIIFHQLFEGLSLGIRIAALPPPHPPASENLGSSRSSSPHITVLDDPSHSHYHNKSWSERWLTPTLSILFATTTPFGMMLGALLFTPSKSITSPAESARMHLTQGLMSAISAGMLIYASTVEMLAGDFVFGDISGDHGHGHAHAHAHDRAHDHSHEHGHGHLHEHGHDKPPLGPNAMKMLAVCSLLAGSTAMALVGMGE